MDAGTEFSMKLTDGKTLTYRIIGINHDDPAGGSGKAGLTFLTTTTGIWSPMNAIDTNAGGWEKSELRQKMNSGKIWNLMPSDFQSKVKAVMKIGSSWWERSVNPSNSYYFLNVDSSGDPTYADYAGYSYCVCPVWCF